MSNLENGEEVNLADEKAEKNSGITIRVPASIANFGPGFETVALAIKTYLNLKVKVQAPRKNQGIEIHTVGSEAALLPTDNTNLIARVIEQVWPQDPGFLSCLSITIDSEIPIASGLGSSAAATVAGVTAAMALSGMRLEKGEIFERAAKIEGHADGACAAVFGGFAMCAPNIVPGDMLPRKLMWPEKWSILAAIPAYKVYSKKARATLPASVSHKDAVINVQKMALLIEAIAAGDDDAMRAALRDKLHEPYKSKLVPELSELRKFLQNSEAIGTVLSGSGPAIVSVVDRENKESLLLKLNDWSQNRKVPVRIQELEVDDNGLYVTD